MISVWIRTEDNLYRVRDDRSWGGIEFLTFLGEIAFDGQSPLDVHAMLPHLDVDPDLLLDEERWALSHAEILVGDENGYQVFRGWSGEKAALRFGVELHLDDGTVMLAIGDVETLFRLFSMVDDEEAVPMVVEDAGGVDRILIPHSLIGIGRIWSC